MAYKLQELVQQGYDFKALFPEKQQAVRQSTGLDFYLDSIVKFLQKQTNNFTLENPIAHDLDNAIFEIVNKFEEKRGGEPMEEKPEEKPLEKSEEETRKEILEAIELLEMLGDDADEATKEALDILKSLV